MSDQNPSTKACWITCGSCFRCGDKGRYTFCNKCSGRHDPFLQTIADPDDYCRCTEGILQWRAKSGQQIITKFNKDPFNSKVITETKTEDEKEWDQYLHDVRERMDNPDYDPISALDVQQTSGFKYLGRDYGKD
jgi:hypothetical protein